MSARNPNRASTVYMGADGRWHGRVTVGFADDGSPDRRHVTGKSKGVVVAKVRALEKNRDQGQVQRAGHRWTVEGWLEHWLENIAAPNLRPTSLAAYRTAIRKHLLQGVDQHRLDRLKPAHLERLYRKMVSNGAGPATAHQVQRTIRTALGVRRSDVVMSAATSRRWLSRRGFRWRRSSPTTSRRSAPFSRPRRGDRPNRARWAIALALGLRQGEVLGLRWSDVDLERGLLWVRKSRLRPIYRHGAAAPAEGSRAGARGSSSSTARTAKPNRAPAVGWWVCQGPLVDLLVLHREQQEFARRRARQLWRESGRVFTSATREPLNPNTDYHRWKALLKAGVRAARLQTRGTRRRPSCLSWGFSSAP